MPHSPLFLAGHVDVPALKQAISAIARFGYCEGSIAARLGLEDITALNWRHLPIYRAERLAARDPLDLAIELLLLQRTLTASELDSLPEALRTSGLLQINEQGAGRARASLYSVGSSLILADHAWPEINGEKVGHDHVMAVGLDSRHLAHCTVRRPVGAALDLCTGSGIHALLASYHAKEVVAVDINPRAVSCTRLNAEVLGLENLRVLQGDLYSPVGDRRFDLITANPPFVPAPAQAVGFRDGGHSGEDIQQRIVAGLPRHLAPFGNAQMVTELGEREDGERLTTRLRRWLGDAPIDIHLLRLASFSVAQYAVGHAQGDTYPAFLESTGEWADNLRAQRFTKIHSVVITFSWSAGKPWEREDDCPAPRAAAGREIERIFEAENLVRRVDFPQWLTGKRVHRAGPIARFDAGILNGEASAAQATATLLGQALKIEHPLADFERQVLDGLAETVAVSDLFALADRFGTSREQLLTALRSLLSKRLIALA